MARQGKRKAMKPSDESTKTDKRDQAIIRYKEAERKAALCAEVADHRAEQSAGCDPSAFLPRKKARRKAKVQPFRDPLHTKAEKKVAKLSSDEPGAQTAQLTALLSTIVRLTRVFEEGGGGWGERAVVLGGIAERRRARGTSGPCTTLSTPIAYRSATQHPPPHLAWAVGQGDIRRRRPRAA
eukprot:CAMPEP_0175917970 /NCGR_PEP_ID=MMETSP0108-20121206/11638_1 /TAXON_ID=195067 ORGANISM="Goniomonas pacifica, Strain CCMP1869" /NCGR_SAMPLE_ID=MMETSP0108 /ASSEMBLY_ACC=CAM_ASM_000204 /LENGTH=181 /DNA_ID=CAMNT_0017240573 /DNA_START=136 /DNA_END=683 /DNA_ORIENTATION=+